MRIGPFTITRTKALQLKPLSPGSNGWWPWGVIRESWTGAWQANVEVRSDTVLTYSAVFACVTLIASDIAKLRLRLVEQTADGIWQETESPAFSPFLRKPNRYQTRIKFVEQWMTSKLIHGNAYVLKERDQRGLVVAAYVLDPTRVTPLVSTDGSVYYQLRRDDLSGLSAETVTVPAKEIIHDLMVALYHPLIGVSPIFASGIAAMQGLAIQQNSQKFFSNGSNPGGVLTAPGAISDETAARLKAHWDAAYTGENVGKVAVLGDGLSYKAMAVNANDAQLIEQLRWSAETVCSCFHVLPYMIGVGPPPPYANVEPLLQAYYSQALQILIESFELSLDEGLGMAEKIEGRWLGTEFDLDDLFRMDTATKTKAAMESINSGGMSPNEARLKYFDLGPVPGGATPYLQQQYWPLSQLSERAIPTTEPVVTQPPASATETDNEDEEAMAAGFAAILHQAALTEGLYVV